jgi:hypothetical protein
MNTLVFENNLLDLVTAIVMVPVAAVYGLCWLIWQGVAAIAPYWQYIGLALAIVGVGWLFVAVPALPLGLAITAVVGWATMPRSPRNGGWGRGVSWNSGAVSYANS